MSLPGDDAKRFSWRPSVPAGIVVGRLEDIPDGSAKGFVIEIAASRFEGFAVRRGDRLYGYVDRCPHAFASLTRDLESYLAEDGSAIQCTWHGARFDIEGGRCFAGPCRDRALLCWPLDIVDGAIVTA